MPPLAARRAKITAAKYQAMRERLGTYSEVARALGVSICTVEGRETGRLIIRVEAELALRYLNRHGLHRHPTPRLPSWAEPGELREALRLLGWGSTEAARVLLGEGESNRMSICRMLTGTRPVSERVARLVKVRLGLDMIDPWPKVAAMDWDVSLPEGMEGMG